MAWKQLRSVNLNTTDNSGWCLRFVGNAFNTPNRPHAHATAAWNGAKKKHADRNFPAGVAVPVFFTWTGTIDGVKQNWGDVAIRLPDGRIFGSPMKGAGKTNRYDSSVDARAKAMGGGAQYIGWTEDINGYDIVSYTPDPPPAKTYTEAQYNAVVKERDAERAKVATLNTQIQTLTKQLADNDKAHLDALKKLQTEIDDYKQSYDELNKTIEIKDKEIKRLEALAGEEVRR
jgi:hypothetical protein